MQFETEGKLANHRQQEHMLGGGASTAQNSQKRTSDQPAKSSKKRRKSKAFRCSVCLERFATRSLLFSHKMRNHFDHSVLMNNGECETEPWVDSDGNVNEQLRNVFLDNRDHILANSSISDAISLFNTPLIASPETDRRA